MQQNTSFSVINDSESWNVPQ